ncbi:MAG: caspase family protein [Bacteroidota bacterium]
MKGLFILVIYLLCLNTTAFAQATKGLSTATNPTEAANGKTYGLIIGISKYKNPAIPALQFADKDAIEFRDFLISSGIDSNNITLLTNENATDGNILTELDNICSNKAQKGDKVFFYFSGHGDVESKVITNDGYLLPYDAPRSVYAISAININILQTYIATLSAHGVQAILITDACHSGNLSGGLEGMKNISGVLKTQWKDEVKILSCQSGELSLEGKQWGNGRGLFSYELINGMAGLADRNKDGKVSLFELNRYLMDKVPDAASPISQIPVLTGNMETTLSLTNNKYLLKHTVEPNTIAYVDTKGLEYQLLKSLPDSIKHFYTYFKILLDNGNKEIIVGTTNAHITMPDKNIKANSGIKEMNSIIYDILSSDGYNASGTFSLADSFKTYRNDFPNYPLTANYYVYKNSIGLYRGYFNDTTLHQFDDTLVCTITGFNVSALDYLNKIPENKDTKLLISIMKRNYIAGTINKINETIKQDFEGANWIFRLSKAWFPYTFASSFRFTDPEIDQLSSFISTDKLREMRVLPKVYYLKAKIRLETHHKQNKSTKFDALSISLLDSSLALEPLASYSLFYKSYNYFADKQFDSSIKYAKKALEVSPSLFYCYRILTGCYMQQNKIDSSIKYYKCLEKHLSHCSKDSMITEFQNIAQKAMGKANFIPEGILHIVTDNFYRFPVRKLYAVYSMLGNADSANKYRLLYFSHNDQKNDSLTLGKELLYENEDVAYFCKRYQISIKNRLQVLSLSTTPQDSFFSYYKLSYYHSLMHDQDNALKYLETAFSQFGTSYIKYEEFQSNKDFDYIRSTPQFADIVKKYFPQYYKK